MNLSALATNYHIKTKKTKFCGFILILADMNLVIATEKQNNLQKIATNYRNRSGKVLVF